MTDVGSSSEGDSVYMRRALALAQLGWGQTAPNPMVGAVVVAGGTIIGEGFHARLGEAHAEPIALQSAGARARGATLYVNLEPCTHHGKTPPCVDAVLGAGIVRVVVAARDPNVAARGGIEALRAAAVRVDVGIERAAALELNAPFYSAHTRSGPWVTLKFAISADGGIADPSGGRRWITGRDARLETHRQRANADAIAVGVGTVIADDPMLTVRDVTLPRVFPRRIVFDWTLRTPLSSQLVTTAREFDTTIVGGPDAIRSSRSLQLLAAGVRVISSCSMSNALAQLHDSGVRALYVEGGARLAGALLTESLIDRLIIFRSPIVLGRGALQAFAFAPASAELLLAESRVVERRQIGEDVMTIYSLKEVPCSPD